MSISEEFHENCATINIMQRLTFEDCNAYREKLNQAIANKVSNLNINLGKLDFMDSSGLGMLMVTENECSKNQIRLQLLNPIGEVKKLLELTRCYERFTIIEN